MNQKDRAILNCLLSAGDKGRSMLGIAMELGYTVEPRHVQNRLVNMRRRGLVIYEPPLAGSKQNAGMWFAKKESVVA